MGVFESKNCSKASEESIKIPGRKKSNTKLGFCCVYYKVWQFEPFFLRMKFLYGEGTFELKTNNNYKRRFC